VKEISLNLETLNVESFETDPAAPPADGDGDFLARCV
jgi:hypothetical protein